MKQMQFQRKALPTQLELLLLLLLLSIPSPVAAAQQHLLTACMMHVPRRRQAQFQLQPPPPPCSSLLACCICMDVSSVCLLQQLQQCLRSPLSSSRLPVSASSRLHLRLSPSLSLILLSVCCLHCLLIRPLDGAALFVCFLKLQSFYTLHHGKHDPYFWQASCHTPHLSR